MFARFPIRHQTESANKVKKLTGLTKLTLQEGRESDELERGDPSPPDLAIKSRNADLDRNPYAEERARAPRAQPGGNSTPERIGTIDVDELRVAEAG